MEEFLEILEELEAYLGKAPRIPFTGKALVAREVLLGYLDRLRLALPEEFRQAQWVLKERERVLAEARAKAEEMLAEGKKKAMEAAMESEVVKQAREKAEELVARAREAAREIRLGANSYAEGILGRLENQLERLLAMVKEGRRELQQPREEKGG